MKPPIRIALAMSLFALATLSVATKGTDGSLPTAGREARASHFHLAIDESSIDVRLDLPALLQQVSRMNECAPFRCDAVIHDAVIPDRDLDLSGVGHARLATSL